MSVDEGSQIAFDSGFLVETAQRLDVALARLMNHGRTLIGGQARDRARHGLVQRRCAQTAADDEDAQRPGPALEALGGRRQLGDLAAHRVADPLRFRQHTGEAATTRSATRASTRFARPAIEFCSWTTSFRPSSTAIIPPGKLT